MNYTDAESCLSQLKKSTDLFSTKPEPFRIAFAIMLHAIPDFCFETLLASVEERRRYALLIALRNTLRITLLNEWLEALADWHQLSCEVRQSVYGYTPSNAIAESLDQLGQLVGSRIEEMQREGKKTRKPSSRSYIVFSQSPTTIKWNGSEEQLRVLHAELLNRNCIGNDTEWEQFRRHFVDSEFRGKAIVWTAEAPTLSFWYFLWLLNTGSDKTDALVSGELFIEANIGRFSTRFIQPEGKTFNKKSLLATNRKQVQERGTNNIAVRGVIKPIVEKVKAAAIC